MHANSYSCMFGCGCRTLQVLRAPRPGLRAAARSRLSTRRHNHSSKQQQPPPPHPAKARKNVDVEVVVTWAGRKFPRLVLFADKYPLRLGCAILATKGLVCDTLAQRAVEGKAAAEQDWRRTAVMAAYGGLCEAPLVFVFYSHLFPLLFGAARTLAAVGQMLLVENLLLWPLLIYPTYYCMEAVGDPGKVDRMRLALFEKAAAPGAGEVGDDTEEGMPVAAAAATTTTTTTTATTTLDDVKFNLSRYRADWWEISRVSMQVWVPANFINFRFMPTSLRTPFMGVVAFGYTTFFAAQQAQLRRKDGGADGDDDDAEAVAS